MDVLEGSYTLTITDDFGCDLILNYDINSSDAAQINSGVIINENCGQADGSITGISVSSNYTDAEWTDANGDIVGSNSLELIDIPSGTYTLTIIDENNCPVSETFNVQSNAGPTISDGTITNASCNFENGSINGINTSNTDGTETFEWTNLNGDIVSNTIDLSNVAAGDYTLTISSDNGCTDQLSFNIPDDGSIQIDSFDTEASNCEESDGEISNIAISGGVGPIDYEWTDANGSTVGTNSSELSNVPAGDYTLTVTDDIGCSTSEIISITNNGIPGNPDFSMSGSSFCINDANPISVSQIQPGGEFSISSGTIDATTGEIDLSSLSQGQTVTVTYTTAAPCQESESTDINILFNDNASFGYTANSYCISASDPSPDFIAAPGGSFAADNGLIINAQTGEVDLSSATVGVTYNITYTTNGQCPVSSTEQILVDLVDDASFSIIEELCIGANNPFATDIATEGGSFSADGGLNIDAQTGEVDLSSGTVGTTYSITYETFGACANNSSLNLTITELDDASFAYQENSYCPDDLNPSAQNIITPGGIFSANNGLEINPINGEIDLSSASTGETYQISYTTIGECSNISVFNISIPEIPNLNIDLQEEACVGSEVIINGGADASFGTTDFLWNFDGANELSGNGSGPYTLMWDEPGIYTVSFDLTNTPCSVESVSADILVNQMNVLTVDNQTIYHGETIILNTAVSSANNPQYNWTPDETLSCNDCPSPFASPDETTTYTVFVEDQESGCNAATSVLVTVEYLEPYVPNAFSPNSDGLNDEVVPLAMESVISFEFEIYNRWGELIFKTDNQSDGWDGTFNGKELNPGVYVWQGYYIMQDGTELIRKGNITLIR